MWEGAINGLARGVTNVGLQWATQALNIPQWVASLGATALVGAIEGLLEKRNPIEGAIDSYIKAGTYYLTLGTYDPQTGEIRQDPWSQACYISQILDFSQIIQDRGIVDALETYAIAYLHQTTIDEIWKLGGIYDLLMNSNQIEIKETCSKIVGSRDLYI